MIWTGCGTTNPDSVNGDLTKSWNTDSGNLLDSIPSNWMCPSDFVFDYFVSISSKEGFLPVRSKMNLDNNEIIAYLYHGTNCNLVDHFDGFFKISFRYKNSLIEGFLIDSYNGKPTVVSCAKKKGDIMKCSSNYITNPILLPFCRFLINSRFDEMIQEYNVNQDKEIFFHDLLCKFYSENSNPLFFALFIGESLRVPYIFGDKVSSDICIEHIAVRNSYYFISSNYHCEVDSYSPPKRVDHFAVLGDTLVGDFEGLSMLYPLNPKFAFSNSCQAAWILEDSVHISPNRGKSKYLDISYLLEKECIAHEQISHGHLMELVRKYVYESVQLKWK